MRKLSFVVFFLYIILLNSKYFEIEHLSFENETHDSVISLTVDGVATTDFPTQQSGKGIESIVCDKGANGVWDYRYWTLKVQNVTENRTKCQINFTSKYTESILKGTDPVLKEGLIPVMIDENGTVIKASEGWEWYDYETKNWANAVILLDSSVTYQYGEVIPESNIESYFVWIPRYKYKLFNEENGIYSELTTSVNNPETIDIQFGTETTGDTDTTCKTPMVSGESGTCSKGKYMTHPAFLSFGTNGIWVGKFETGYKGAISTEEAQTNTNVNDSSKIQIKPNVYSWRNIQLAKSHTASYNYRREYDSHVMKNTEWGAVAYLQHSIYGSGNTSVRINNNSAYITGYAAKNEPTCGYTETNESCNKYESTARGVDGNDTYNYLNPLSVVASTTGNYSGIYDMSGGAWEYVMGVMLSSDHSTKCSGVDVTWNSGFNGPYCYTSGSTTDGIDFPEAKYYDTYAYATVDERYDRRILGDATGEMGPFSTKTYGLQQRQVGSWHDDEAWFVYHGYPWFRHGGNFDLGSGAGVFAFVHVHGSSNPYDSFRVVLAF